MPTKMSAAQRRVRNTKRTAAGTFYATAAATIAANMYASEHTWIGLFTGFWTPVALFLALEMVERVHCKGWLGTLRKVGVGVIALVALWVSYGHLVYVFDLGGADAIGAHAMPLTVDVLMAIARGAMITRPASPSRRTRKTVTKGRALKAVA